MGMGNEDLGECSQHADSDEQPLKKARYVWQLKGKYHLKQNMGCPKDQCIDEILAETEALLDSEEEDGPNIDKSIHSEIPLTLVSPGVKDEDFYLKKWQARQIARGYIDNTINSVLETWTSVPLDVEDFVDSCNDDGHVEDEGILMAIQAHGLQSNQSKQPFVRPDILADSTLEEFDKFKNQLVLEVEKSVTGGPQEDIGYPVDILNAAILVAIEKKGLSS